MAESVFKSRTLGDVYDEIRGVYLGDDRPWILGFSGGKDSTCMVQLIWNALAKLPPERLAKKVFIISSDTLVESPNVAKQITATLEMMEEAAKKSSLPVSTNLVRPVIGDTFWVCLLGRGYPAPSNMFRWCTDRLKIRNADRFIRERVSEHGEAVVVLGTRKEESSSRQQLMNLYEIKGSLLSRHSKFAQTYVYTPVRDFTAGDIWNYLLQNKNPWGANNRDLLALYQSAKSAECPLVVDTTTPSCGNSRFGCWTCTVVESERSLGHMIENGEEWMEPLLELRDELKETQEPARRREVRSLRRRSGNMKLVEEGRRRGFDERMRRLADGPEDDPHSKLAPGPYTMKFCREFLAKLLRAQAEVRRTGPDPRMTLILPEEIHEIQRIWRAERGDWRDSAYQIYQQETGERLTPRRDGLGGFGDREQEYLEEICNKHGVPSLLVSKLFNAELESRGAARRAGIHKKITSILSEEWREDMGEIVRDLERRRAAGRGLSG